MSIPLRPLYNTMPYIDFINGFPNQPWGCKCTSASAYCENKKALNLKKPEDTIVVYSSLVIFRV